MKSLFAFHPQSNACNYNRIALPSLFCQGKELNIDLGPDLPKNGGKYDSVMVHGVYPAHSMLEYLRLKLRGKNFIWAIDDDYLTIPEWNGNSLTEDTKEFHELVTGFADSIIVSTEYLKSKFRRSDVYVCPNFVDLTKFSTVKSTDEKITILWQGSPTHKEDVEIAIPALAHVLSKYPDRVTVVMFGGTFPVELSKYLYSNLIIEPAVKITEYHSKLIEINPDITIAPLVDCEFNRSKSNLRVLEGWASNSAVLASNVEPYKCITTGYTGLLANNKDEFIDQLELLVQNDLLRETLSNNGRICVENTYSWQNSTCVAQWISVLKQIL